MHLSIRRFSSALALAAASAWGLSAQACALEPLDLPRIKQIMAQGIAFRLGLPARRVPLNVLSTPQLHAPPLGRDCSGIERIYHSAAFRIVVPSQAPASSAPGRWPEYAREPSVQRISRKRESTVGSRGADGPGRWRGGADWPGRWHGDQHCAYEGVAVVLGYGYARPAQVNFQRHCW